MKKAYKSLIAILIALCIFGAQSPSYAKMPKFNFFKKHKAKQEQTVPENNVQESDANESVKSGEVPAVELQKPDETYIDEDNAVYVKSLEIMGNNMVDTAFIKGIIVILKD